MPNNAPRRGVNALSMRAEAHRDHHHHRYHDCPLLITGLVLLSASATRDERVLCSSQDSFQLFKVFDVHTRVIHSDTEEQQRRVTVDKTIMTHPSTILLHQRVTEHIKLL